MKQNTQTYYLLNGMLDKPMIPFFQLRIDIKGAVFKVNLGIGCFKVERGRDLAVFEGQDSFDKTGDTGCAVTVADN